MKKSLGLVLTAALVWGPVIPALAQGNVTQSPTTVKTQAEVSHVTKKHEPVIKPVFTDQNSGTSYIKPEKSLEKKSLIVKSYKKEVVKISPEASVCHPMQHTVHYIDYAAIASPPPGGFKAQPSYGGPVVASCNMLATKYGLKYQSRLTFMHECIMNTLTKELNLSHHDLIHANKVVSDKSKYNS